MKIAKKHLSILLAIALLFSIFSVGSVSTMAESTNPAPVDDYIHTVADGLDYLKATEISSNNTASVTVGDISADYLAYGASKGIYFTHTNAYAGYFAFYSQSNKVVRTGLMPADLSEYDGIRFYLAVNNIQKDATTGETKDSLPGYLSIQLVDENGNGIADAQIKIATAQEKQNYKQWVYLEPSNFTLVSKVNGNDKVSTTKLTSFPKAYSFEIRWRSNNSAISPSYSQYDVNKDFEVYFSGLSYYKKNAINTTNPQRNDNFVHTSLNGIQTLTSTNMSGVTSEIVTENVAYGATNALKVGFNVGKGYATYAYAYSSSKVIPNNVMPSTLSEYDGISMFLTIENNNFDDAGNLKDSLPQYVSFKLIDANCKIVAEAWIPTNTANKVDKHFYQGWVYLEPSDFYVVTYDDADKVVHPTNDTAKLTAFPDAATFAFCNRNINNTDAYKKLNVYVSGMSVYEVNKNAVPTDKYVHTFKVDGLEKLDISNKIEPRGSQISITATPKVTVAKHVAYGSENAFKISYKKSSDGWSQIGFYGSGTKAEPCDMLPSNFSQYDGIRMFLSVDSTSALSSEQIKIQFTDSYGSNGSSEYIITLDKLNADNRGWVYITPADFGLEKFNDKHSRLVIKTKGTVAFDVYLSGMSAYVNTDIAEMRSALLGEITTNNVRHAVNGDDKVDIRDLVWLYNYTK